MAPDPGPMLVPDRLHATARGARQRDLDTECPWFGPKRQPSAAAA